MHTWLHLTYSKRAIADEKSSISEKLNQLIIYVFITLFEYCKILILNKEKKLKVLMHFEKFLTR